MQFKVPLHFTALHFDLGPVLFTGYEINISVCGTAEHLALQYSRYRCENRPHTDHTCTNGYEGKGSWPL